MEYNVSSPVPTKDGTFWQNLGHAWDKEKGISIQLNALPIEGKLFLNPITEEKGKK